MKNREKRNRNNRQVVFFTVCLAVALTIAAQASGCRDSRKLQKQAPPPSPATVIVPPPTAVIVPPPTAVIVPPPAPPIPPEWIKSDVIHGRWNATLDRWEFTGRNAELLGTVRWNRKLNRWEYNQ